MAEGGCRTYSHQSGWQAGYLCELYFPVAPVPVSSLKFFGEKSGHRRSAGGASQAVWERRFNAEDLIQALRAWHCEAQKSHLWDIDLL